MIYPVSELSAASPDMGDAEFAEFVADIKERGQLIPIVISGGEVIDGRKRLRACQQLGVEPRVVDLGGGDPRAAARSLNLLRTHYTPSQRAMFAAQRANLARGQVRSQVSELRDQGRPAVSIGRAAREAGVEPSTVSEAKRLVREAAPEVVQAVKDGKLTVHKAAHISREVPKAEQAEATRRAVAAPKRSPVVRALGGRITKRSPVRPAARQIAVMAEQASMAVRHMENVTDAAPVAVSDACLDLLRETRARLAKVIHRLEENHGSEAA